MSNSMSNMTVTGSIHLLVDINPRGYHPLSNQSLEGIVRLVVRLDIFVIEMYCALIMSGLGGSVS